MGVNLPFLWHQKTPIVSRVCVKVSCKGSHIDNRNHAPGSYGESSGRYHGNDDHHLDVSFLSRDVIFTPGHDMNTWSSGVF